MVSPVVPRLPDGTAYSTPVPRRLVHKSAHSEVLLTGWRRLGETAVEVGAQWPRDHGFWRTGADGRQDPMLMVETTRQVLPLVSHAVYGVPEGHHLTWERYACRFAVPFLRVSARPAEVTLRLALRTGPRPGRRVRRLALAMTVRAAGRDLGSVSTHFSVHSPEVYRRLRGSGTPGAEAAMAAVPAPPPAVPPARVGRESEREVVLAPTGDPLRWRLRVATASPWLFDHPVDHVPGMLLLEAVRQGAHLAASHGMPAGTGEPARAAPRAWRLSRLDAVFHRFVELGAPCWIEAVRTAADARAAHGAHTASSTPHAPRATPGAGGEDEDEGEGGRAAWRAVVTQDGEEAATVLVGLAREG